MTFKPSKYQVGVFAANVISLIASMQELAAESAAIAASATPADGLSGHETLILRRLSIPGRLLADSIERIEETCVPGVWRLQRQQA